MNGDIVVKNVARDQGNVENDVISGDTSQMMNPVNDTENTSRLQDARNGAEILPPPATKAIDITIENIPINHINHLARPLLDLDLTRRPENLHGRTNVLSRLLNQLVLNSPPTGPNSSVPRAAAE